QAFFVEVVLERRLFQRANQQRGSMRSLILTALKRFAIDENRKRVSGISIDRTAVDGLEQKLERNGGLKPEGVFDRQWAVAVLDEVLRRAEAHYRDGQLNHWLAFERRVLLPSMGMTKEPSHEEVAADLGLASPAASIEAIRVVRKRLRILLRQVIGET